MSDVIDRGIIPIDRAATEQLGGVIGRAVREHYLGRPRNSGTVYEVLNALAGIAGIVIKGAGADAKRVRAWFDLALDNQLLGEEEGHG